MRVAIACPRTPIFHELEPFGGLSNPSLTPFQVTKFSLHNVPNPHTNQVLYEAEVWIKDARGRRKLDLMVKYPAHAAAATAVTAASGSSPLSGGSLVGALFGPPETACFAASCFMLQDDDRVSEEQLTPRCGRCWSL